MNSTTSPPAPPPVALQGMALRGAIVERIRDTPMANVTRRDLEYHLSQAAAHGGVLTLYLRCPIDDNDEGSASAIEAAAPVDKVALRQVCAEWGRQT